MQEYERFAEVYDLFMSEIPYEKWCTYIVSILKENGIEDGLLLDLGCGTGTMTMLLSQAGYDMTGVDQSVSMLQEAMEKQGDGSILYLNQDMREFELYGTMRAIVSVCDTMNYLTEREDFVQVLKLVNNYLDPDGLFIFDVKTKHYYSEVLGDGTWAVNEDSASYIWENSFDPETDLNEYLLTIYLENEDGLYERAEEYHLQRAYSITEIREMAAEAGMKFEGAFDECTKNPANGQSDRIHVILREQGKAREINE